ncbi:hypothetical protein DFH08DRAFT_1033452 [Mycena albidolilacea]|uniref:Uncharacterized protein n=1 Tax=Mycena albidolilacea TaxID=1033008 RepID=A0AAD6ZGL6_9AGAR|nr:hypothetical protein DFH08DRAFT_1033452 [Mycena albidolilacea]
MLFPLYALCFCVPGMFAAQRNITVDDTDPSISYAGSGWVFNNATDVSHAYNDTFHAACPTPGATSTSSATFNFTGVAIYYQVSYFCAEIENSPALSFTTLALDGGDPIAVDMRPLFGDSDVLVLWAKTGLSNGPHTITALVGNTSAALDAFIYTAEEPDEVPAAPAGFTNVFVSADTFSYSDGWANSSDTVPSCAKSPQLRTTSVANSTFSFNFSGDELFLNTLASPSGGSISVSINDDEPEVFDTTAPTASCALLNLNVTSLVKRNLVRRGGDSSNVQNQCSGKSISGTNALDGATYRQESSGVRAYGVTAQSVLAMLGFTVFLADFDTLFL